jgi:hypothetical protein
MQCVLSYKYLTSLLNLLSYYYLLSIAQKLLEDNPLSITKEINGNTVKYRVIIKEMMVYDMLFLRSS